MFNEISLNEAWISMLCQYIKLRSMTLIRGITTNTPSICLAKNNKVKYMNHPQDLSK